jgi:TatA/E family protein of Tat protein translocase
MGFLGIGAMEALVIVVIALIIFGPGRLPEIMGDAGRMVRDFRRATRELTGDFEDSMAEVRGTYRELETEMRDTATGLRRDAKSMADEVNTAVTDASKLDEGTRPAARRPRGQDKLDQIVEPQARETADRARAAARGRKVESPAPKRETAITSSPNGSHGPVDDLLSLSDSDDLLALDDKE